MHHLILVRESDQVSGSIGCCCRVGRDDVRWDHSAPLPTSEATTRFRDLYHELRERFGDRLEITVLDPRNVIAFVPLVLRDALRFGVPLGEALRAIGGTSYATAVLDGRLMFSGVAPPSREVVERVAERLEGPPASGGSLRWLES
jgi:hypothetical protein